MMALAALSMALQNGIHNADALEHYQQVIPALKITVQRSQDSYSDGALLTHFILLLYEVRQKFFVSHHFLVHMAHMSYPEYTVWESEFWRTYSEVSIGF